MYITLARRCTSVFGKLNKKDLLAPLQFRFKCLPFHDSTTKRKQKVYSGAYRITVH